MPLRPDCGRGPSPFDLEEVNEPWAEELRQLNPTTFPNGGHRWCVPLRTGEQSLGALVLADRVNGADYTVEELELLQCIADQMTSVLLNLRLASEVARARELEAFRTMSAFFVHDLKNAAASLNLMLKNLPVHFDDPAFREDALRGVGNTARRIDEMIARLSALRQRPDFKPVEADLNALVSEAVDRLDGMPQRRADEGASAAARDPGRPRTDPERRHQPAAQRARRRCGAGRAASRCERTTAEAASCCRSPTTAAG